jgi:hypothetical protein
VGRALANSAVDEAFDRAFDRIGADGGVSTAGSALLSRMGNDPAIAERGQRLVARLGESEVFRSFVRGVQKAHPDDAEAELDRQIDALFSSKEMDTALSHASHALMKRPALVDAIHDLTRGLLASGKIEGAIAHALMQAIEQASKRHAAATLGVPRWDPRYNEALSHYLEDPERMSRVLLSFAQTFGEHPAPRQAIARVLSSPSFFEESVLRGRQIMEDDDFLTRAERALIAVVAGTSANELEQRVLDVMTAPAVERGAADWLRSLGRTDDVVREFVLAFVAVGESPDFVNAIDQVYFGERGVAQIGEAPR